MLTISDIATKHLEQWLDQLILGELELWQLPPAVAAFYNAGVQEGLTLNPHTIEIEWLQYECDRLYLAAFSPKQRRDMLLKQHQQRDQFEWELFENSLLNIINGLEVAPGRAEVELTDDSRNNSRYDRAAA